MQVQLRPFNFAEAVARAGLTPTGQPISPKPRGEGAELWRRHDAGAQERQRAAERSPRLQREVQLDNPTVSLEETMVSMQKAQIGFQAALQVRNRLVSAYLRDHEHAGLSWSCRRTGAVRRGHTGGAAERIQVDEDLVVAVVGQADLGPAPRLGPARLGRWPFGRPAARCPLYSRLTTPPTRSAACRWRSCRAVGGWCPSTSHARSGS